MSTQEVPRRPKNFEEFYRADYRSLMRDVIFAGGKPHEAEDVISTAMIEVLQRWESIKNPRAYARRAAIRNLIKDRQRELRIQERLTQSGQVPPEHYLDPSLMVWEQQEWVTLLLKSLPPAQREVLAWTVDTFKPREIAQLLGKTEAAVRKNLQDVRRRLADCLAETDVAEEAQ
jgi:RNA polymerase sigma factor (sigma-70 family)